MVKYKPKYFKISPNNDFKDKRYYIKVSIIIIFSLIILFVIIYTLYNIFLFSPYKSSYKKVDYYSIKNEIKRYYISGNYLLIKDKIENILTSLQLDKEFKKELLILYLDICILLKDKSSFQQYLNDYSSLLSKEEKNLLTILFHYKYEEFIFAKEQISKFLGIKIIKNKNLNLINYQFKLNNIIHLEMMIIYIDILNKEKNFLEGEYLIKSLKNNKNYENITNKLNVQNYKLSIDSLINFNIEKDIRNYFDMNLAYFLFQNGKIVEALELLVNLLSKKLIPENEKRKNILISNIYYNLGKYSESKEYLKEAINFGIDYETYYYNYFINLYEQKNLFYKNYSNFLKVDDLEIKKEFLYNFNIYSSFAILLYLNGFYDKVITSYEYYKIGQFINSNFNLDNYNNLYFFIDYIYLESFFRYYYNFFDKNKELREKLFEISLIIGNKSLNSSNFIIFSKLFLNILIYLDDVERFNNFVKENINVLKNNIELIQLIIFYNIKKKNFNEAYNFLQNNFDRNKDIFYFYYFYSLIELYDKNDINLSLRTISNLENVKLEKVEKSNYYYYKSFLLYLLGKKEEAYNNLLNVEVFNDNIANFYLFILNKLEKYDEILKFYDNYIKVSSENIYLYFYKGIALYKIKNYEEALNYFLKVLETNISEKIKSVCCTYIGNIYFYLGNYDSAINFYQEALLYDKENLTVKINLNRINKK